VKKYGLALLFTVVLYQGWSQIRLTSLILKQNETFEFKNTDILVVDTLIMRDSSRIILNKSKAENFIHAKYLLVGNGCLIDGEGIHGKPGKAGRAGATSSAPCRIGAPGGNALPGEKGRNGLTLSFYITNYIINGSLIIDLNGGDGGDGGRGGNGGSGGGGTRVCTAGNGGPGGNGGNGADGGQGGTLNIHCKECRPLNLLIGDKIQVRNFGGFGGLAGVGGFGGQAGLGPSPHKDGQNGPSGKNGTRGKQGKRGYYSTIQE
jgi:hypothetical protein